MNRANKLLLGLTAGCLSLNVWSQSPQLWLESAVSKDESNTIQQGLQKQSSTNLGRLYVGERAYQLDISSLEQLLISNKGSSNFAGKAQQIVSLPLPSGDMVSFILKPVVTMENALAKKFPSIKTFSGHQVDHPNHTGRFDITPHGFHGMFNYKGQRIFIDPIQLMDRQSYRVYDAAKAVNLEAGIREDIDALEKLAVAGKAQIKQTATQQKVDFGTELRTYRIAVSAAGEYTAFHGGTKELGLAAVTTAINRVNQVYNKDVAVNLVLVANNDLIIYTDSASDPFNNDAGGDISTNQTVIDDNIGNANYDIGHIFNTGGGGLAGFRVVCGSRKAQGVTGSGSPTGDSFNIDYVAHEIGHQFGGDHTFNGSASSCSGNRVSSAAFEPGSGSTIMAYAGICGTQNSQTFSNDYFHGYSLEQFQDFITNGNGASCGTVSALDNQIPTADAGENIVIPAQTPFQLTGSATDADSQQSTNLTYIWEQRDLGPTVGSPAEMVDDGFRPLFRSFEPTVSPSRIFPSLTSIVSNTTSVFEVLPTTNRDMNFQLTVRDGNGGIAQDMTLVTVTTTSGPFVVTEPSTNIDAIGGMTSNVMWNVANTDIGAVSCPLVSISVSVDGGVNFETMLSETPNDGQADVVMPNVNSTQARAKVACSDGRFFNLSPINFSITQSGVPSITGQQSLNTDEEQSLSISLDDLIVTDIDNNYPQDFTLNVREGDNYSVQGSTITPIQDFNGDLSVNVTVNDGESDSPVTVITVTINPINDAPVISDANNTLSFDEDNSFDLPIDVVAVTDVDNTEFSLQILAGNNYSFNGTAITPTANFSGELNINVTVSDGELTSNQQGVSIAINPINDAPTAANDSLTVSQDSSNNNLSVLTNDNDVDTGDQITITAMSYSGSGTLAIAANGDSIIYTPKDGFFGQESFSYTIQDSNEEQASATATITVTEAPKRGGGGALFYNLLLMVTLIGLRKCRSK